MRLLGSILVRLALGAVSLLFISFVTFIASENAGDPVLAIAGEKASHETIARIRHQMGLDKPWPQRYVQYVWKAAHGDFGNSYYGSKEPVGDILVRDLPMTARLALASVLLAAVVGITLGTLSAVFRNKGPDRGVLIVSTLGVTLPNFVVAPVLGYLFAVKLNQLPLTWSVDRVAPDWVYLILPVAVLSARTTSLLARLTRAAVIETLDQEYIRLATAKGVPPLRLLLKHALRNALLPIITATGTSFGFLLTGSFVVERVFLLPGIGRETIEAIQQGNGPVTQACVFATGAMFVLVNLIVDVFIPILDPRVRGAQI